MKMEPSLFELDLPWMRSSALQMKAVLRLVLVARERIWSPTPAPFDSFGPNPVAPVRAGSTQSHLLHAPGSVPSAGDPHPGDRPMKVLLPCCAGLDVHKTFVVASVLKVADTGEVGKETVRFGT